MHFLENNMKKVLVPLAIKPENDWLSTYLARSTFVQKMLKYNLLPLFVAGGTPHQGVDELYNLADGAFFMGGSDYDPALYGAEKDAATEAIEPLRDEVEMYLLKKLLKDKKPILAMCRGYEGLNIASGGTLVQHVQDKFSEDHSQAKTYVDLRTAPKHVVKIDTDSKIYELMQQEEVMVNSAHHQAIDKVGSGLKIVGVSPAGVPELIESTDPTYFCIGIQAHAEAEEPSFFEPIFAAFAKAVEKR